VKGVFIRIAASVKKKTEPVQSIIRFFPLYPFGLTDACIHCAVVLCEEIEKSLENRTRRYILKQIVTLFHYQGPLQHFIDIINQFDGQAVADLLRHIAEITFIFAGESAHW
jgi:hypothetical protein